MIQADSETDIFLSYSSKRREGAEHFANVLECFGYKVWFDYDLIGGRDFAVQLDERLRASTLTIVLWCPESVKSRWVNEEAHLAESLHRLIPVIMAPCDLKLGMRLLHNYDLASWDGSTSSPQLKPLFEAIAAKSGKRPKLDRIREAAIDAEWNRRGRPTYTAHAPKSDGRDEQQGSFNVVSSVSFDNGSDRRSGDVAQSLVNPGKLTVGIFPYPPLTTGGDVDAMAGPWLVLAQELAAGLGLDAEFRFTSFADLIKNAYLSVDLVTCVFETPRRKNYFDFTRPINRVGLTGLCRTDLPEISEDALRQGDYRVLVQEGEVGWEYINDEAPRAVERKRVTSVDAVDPLEVLSLVRTGRYDVALMDALSCNNFLRDPSLSAGLRLAFDEPLNMYGSGIALRRTSGLNLQKVDELVSATRNSSSYINLELQALKGYEKVIKRTSLK